MCLILEIHSWDLILFQIRNKVTGLCLDSMGRKSGEKVGMVACHGFGGNQVSKIFIFFIKCTYHLYLCSLMNYIPQQNHIYRIQAIFLNKFKDLRKFSFLI